MEVDNKENILKDYKSSSTNILNLIEETLQQLSSPNPETSIQPLIEKTTLELTALKYYTRSAYLQNQKNEFKVKEYNDTLYKNKLLLSSLEYEKEFLERQIKACREYDPVTLGTIAREEMDATSNDTETIINTFLTTNVRDVTNHNSTITKLTDEINRRKELVNVLNEANVEYNKCKERTEGKKRFLDDLPNKLDGVEKASLSLQEYFHSDNCGWMVSSEKKRRVKEAKELEGPLYVLCGQIQAYIDAFSAQDVTLSMKIIDTEIPSKEYIHPTSLQLELVCPSINKDTYHIYFQYSTKHNVVLASSMITSNSSLIKSTKVHKEFLIDLFPGDDGEHTPNLSNYHLDDVDVFDVARPFHWLQSISGLAFLADKRVLEPSTQSVLDQIKLRVRAQYTLSNILSTLEKKPELIPTHSKFQLPQPIQNLQKESDNCRIVSFNEIPAPNMDFYSKSKYCKYYHGKIKKNYSANTLSSKFIDNVILEVYIQIHPSYPNIPPYILLQTKEQNELYQTNLKLLQTFINTKYDCCHLIVDDESLNDWVLSHQMNLLMACWNILRMEDFKNFGFLDGIRVRCGKNRKRSFMN